MMRDQRANDNWVLLLARHLADDQSSRCVVVFNVVTMFLNAPLRHFEFMLKGLEEVTSCLSLSLCLFLSFFLSLSLCLSLCLSVCLSVSLSSLFLPVSLFFLSFSVFAHTRTRLRRRSKTFARWVFLSTSLWETPKSTCPNSCRDSRYQLTRTHTDTHTHQLVYERTLYIHANTLPRCHTPSLLT